MSSRRAVLAAVAAGTAALSGCSQVLGEQSTPTPAPEAVDAATARTRSATPTATPTPTPTATPTPTPDPRTVVESLTHPDDFPVDRKLAVRRGGFHAFAFSIDDETLDVAFEFRARNDEDFDLLGFRPPAFDDYRRLLFDDGTAEPETIDAVTVMEANGYAKRLAASIPTGDVYLVLDHTDFGEADNRSETAGDVEMRVDLDLR